MLTTRTKVSLARWLSRLIVGLRYLSGRQAEVEVHRRGALWDLDLREGIDLAVYLGVYEAWLPRIAKEYLHSGCIALDIGANIGVHTLMFAQLVGPEGQVLAFEPTQFAFRKLQANISLNPELADRITAHQVFLTDGTDTNIPHSVYASWPVTQKSQDIHPVLMGKRMGTEGAEGVSLDEFLASFRESFTRLDFIKLDVDGNELVVLEGAIETIQTFRPTLLIEFSPALQADSDSWGKHWAELTDRIGYELRNPRDGSKVEKEAEALTRIVPYGASIDLIAIPV